MLSKTRGSGQRPLGIRVTFPCPSMSYWTPSLSLSCLFLEDICNIDPEKNLIGKIIIHTYICDA